MTTHLETKKRRARFEVYSRADGRWEWRLVSSNGKVMATSHGQGFRSKRDAQRAIESVRAVVSDASVEE
jgi:uncharacterized protein YegP (UPF0339 family)